MSTETFKLGGILGAAIHESICINNDNGLVAAHESSVQNDAWRTPALTTLITHTRTKMEKVFMNY